MTTRRRAEPTCGPEYGRARSGNQPAPIEPEERHGGVELGADEETEATARETLGPEAAGYSGVSEWGAPTAFDSGEPRWRRKTAKMAIAPTARNFDCQFWSVRSQKSGWCG